MRKAKIFGLVLLFVFVFSSFAFSLEKTQISIGINGGVFASMYGIGGEVMLRLPELKDLYLKLGLVVTDSKHLSPAQDWRRFLPLYIDGIYYFNNNVYMGAGLNYPLKISDGEKPAVGWEAYFGTDVKLGEGKIFIEAGCGELKRESKPSFTGGQVMLGYRYDLAIITVVEEKEVPAAKIPTVGVLVVGKVPTIEVPAAKRIVEIRGIYKAQVGVFRVKGKAERLAQQLESEGFESRIVYHEKMWKVYGGEADSLSQAKMIARKLRARGFGAFIVMRKE